MPALVLFSIGGIAATVGTPSVLVWTLSVLFGFIQAFTYAEIAGLFPKRTVSDDCMATVLDVHISKYPYILRLDPGASWEGRQVLSVG